LKNKLLAALGALLAAAAIYVAVPPPQHARAAFDAQSTWGGTGGGTSSNQTVSLPNVGSLNDILGVPFRYIPSIDNVGPSTITINTLSPVNVVRPTDIGLQPLSLGELQAGVIMTLQYDGTNIEILGPVDMTPIGSTCEYRGGTMPRGCIVEDGSCISQTMFAALNQKLGTLYGTCGTGGLFRLPFSNGTAFFAYDDQGANGAANRVTTASCATPNSPVECGNQLATLTAADIPNLTSTNTNQAIAVNPGGNAGLFVPAAGSGGFGLEPAPTTAGNEVVTPNGGLGSLVNENTFSAPNSISVATTGTGGSAPTHPVLPPMLPGLRGVRF
jgi:hypothetical protein